MAKKTRKDAPASAPIDAAGIKLMQPDRSAPKETTLLDFAGEQNLFKQADARQRQLNKERGVSTTHQDEESEGGDDGEATVSPLAERLLDTMLWCVSLAMLHFTLDVLVQNQYAVEIEWPVIVKRALQSLAGRWRPLPVLPSPAQSRSQSSFPALLLTNAVFSLLFYNLHRHASDPRLLPGLPSRVQYPLRQMLFFLTSALTGCYLIHITNEYSYMAVLQQAPPIGCLWVWSVIELDLAWAVPSLAIAGGFMKLMGYGI